MGYNEITTFTGRNLDPLDLSPDQVDIQDIAHALAQTCRFGGHCRDFYSVAEHSVLVSNLCPEDARLEGLLHDAAEAYLGDVPAPLKAALPNFASVEESVLRVVARKFGLTLPLPASVETADQAMLRHELGVLLPGGTAADPVSGQITCLPPREAKALFLKTYRHLTSTMKSPKDVRVPTFGAVLGIDVGWSETRRSSAACLLVWTADEVRMKIRRFTARREDVRSGIQDLLGDHGVLVAAIDGPLRAALDEIGVYRAAEQVLTRRLARHIGKPAQSSSPNGKRLNAAANQVAELLLELDVVGEAYHRARIHSKAIVEGFPTSFLGVMLTEGFQDKNRARSDSYYKALGAAPEQPLETLITGFLPGRRLDLDMKAITNHDDRAAVVCALTALCVAARSYVAVGNEDGFIILPPPGTEDQARLRSWVRRDLCQNVVECPEARIIAELAGQPITL